MTIDISNPMTTTSEPLQPIIIDLGKKRRKHVRKLRRGKPGRLMDKVQQVIGEISAAGALPGSAQAVVVIVRERKKNKLGRLW